MAASVAPGVFTVLGSSAGAASPGGLLGRKQLSVNIFVASLLKISGSPKLSVWSYKVYAIIFCDGSSASHKTYHFSGGATLFYREPHFILLSSPCFSSHHRKVIS